MANPKSVRFLGLAGLLVGTFATVPFAKAQAPAPAKPNILVIMGDDIGLWNISAYNRGMMGYRTPNIDRIAREGAIFTDYYGQQSCTAGRAAFITGQSPIRTGLLKVGLPGAPEGLSEKDPTIADLLKPQGYATGQFGKNHLGDRNEFLPTVHGFDEFFGNLYHLNAEEEPENVDYPKDPTFKAKFGPRGVLKCVATAERDAGRRSALRQVGQAEVRGHRPAHQEAHGDGRRASSSTPRSTSSTAPTATRSRSSSGSTPAACTSGPTSSRQSEGKTGLGVYADGMVEHDGQVGQLLKKLDDLKIADNTIVIYTTDNGAEVMSWPDGGTTPFRGEKNTNWEGGYRVPAHGALARPGEAGHGDQRHLLGRGLDADPAGRRRRARPARPSCMQGATFGDKTFKVHLDGYDQRELLKNGTGGARKEFFYWTDDGGLAGLRYDKWKLAFMEQRSHGFDVWQDPMVTLRVPKLFDLRADPFERADQRRHGLRPLAHRPRLPAGAGAGLRRPLHPDPGRVPAAPEAGLVQSAGRAATS